MNNILVVNVNWLGDVVFSSPIFKALKQAHPNARISCLAVPRVKEILESIHCIDEIIVYDEKGKDWSLLAKWKLVQTLKARNFDAAFLLHRSWTRAALVFLAGIPHRIGYDEKKRGGFLTHKVSVLPKGAHRLEHYTHIVESFGISVSDKSSRLKVDSASQQSLENMLKSLGVSAKEEFIVVNPGGNWGLKHWPKESFIKLISELVKKYPFKIILTGAAKDVALAAEIKQAVFSGKIFNAAGKTSLKEMIALLQKAKVVVSADSGPIHMAASVGTQVVAMFGPTRHEVTGPRGIREAVILQKDVGCNKEACYYLECPDNVCMQSVSVKDVVDAVEAAIGS